MKKSADFWIVWRLATISRSFANCWLTEEPPATIFFSSLIAISKPWFNSDGSLRLQISVSRNLPDSKMPCVPLFAGLVGIEQQFITYRNGNVPLLGFRALR